MTTVKNITLYCTEGSSDKEYQASIEETNGGFLVNFAYGRRGSALKTGTKTNAPVSFEKAQKVYDSLVKSKTAKGYTEAESGARYVGTDLEERDSGLSPMLPSPIERDELEALINDDDWAFSEKMDGENRIIIIDAEGIRGVNRRGLLCSLRQEWTGEFMIPGDERMVFAGEDMGDHFAVFDLIESEMTDEASDLVVRHKAATYLVGTSDWTRIVPLAVGSEEKRKLLAKVEAEGGEGIVAKRIHTAYTGGRSLDHLKFKFQESATFEVIRINDQRSVGIGLHAADGGIEDLGNVTIPANHDVPAVGDLVEVEYMMRYEGGALMQPKYKGARTDIDGKPSTDQITRIKFKKAA